MFAALPGVGKTRTLFDFLRRVRHGLPWPDGQPMDVENPQEFRTLWVLADEHHGEVVTLAEEFGVEDIIYFATLKTDPFGGTKVDSAEDLNRIAMFSKLVNPRMTIIDTVGGATSKNLILQEEAMAFYKPLSELAKMFQNPYICVTHLNSTGGVLGRRGVERVRSVMMLWAESSERDAKRRLWIDKANCIKPDPLGVTMFTGGADYDDDPPELPDGHPSKSMGPQKSKRTKQYECTVWLWDWLVKGETPCDMVDKVGQRRGYKKEEIDKALAELQPTIKDDGGAKYFFLPPLTRKPEK